MYEVTEAYEEVIDALNADINSLQECIDKADWCGICNLCEAIIAGATVLIEWDQEREAI